MSTVLTVKIFGLLKHLKHPYVWTAHLYTSFYYLGTCNYSVELYYGDSVCLLLGKT